MAGTDEILGTPGGTAAADADPLARMVLAAQQAPPPVDPAQQTSIPPVAQQMDVNTTTPPPVQPIAMPEQMIPSMEAKHHGWLYNALDAASSVLAPNQVARVVKDKDGNISIERDPASQKDKWGQIAAAVIGGGLKGFAAGQGPGGMARAGAAGFDQGFKMPQEREDAVNQQATREQAIMQRNANNAILHQQAMQEMLKSHALGLVVSAKDAENFQGMEDAVAASPNAKDLGNIENLATDLPRLQRENADFLHSHVNSTIKPFPEVGKDGKLVFHAYIVDRAYNEALNEKPRYVWEAGDPTEDGKPTMKKRQVAAYTQHNVDLDTANAKAVNDYVSGMNKYTEAQAKKTTAQRDKVPTTYEGGVIEKYRLKYPDDPQRALDEATEEITKNEKRRFSMPAVNINNSPPTAATLENWGTLVSDPASGVTLANVPPGQRGALVDSMAAKGQRVAKPLTADELKRSDLAHNAITNVTKAQEILKRRPDMFGPTGWGKSKFALAFKGGDPDAIEYMTLMSLAGLPLIGIHGVRGKWAAEDLAKIDSNLYLNAESMGRALDDILGSAQEFATNGGRVKEPGQSRQGGDAQPAPAAAAPSRQAAIQWPTDPLPAGEVYVYIPGTDKPGHIPATKVADFKKVHPNGQVKQ